MSIFTIIEGLRAYNLWRRGDEKIEQPDPKEIGKLIDEAVASLVSLSVKLELAISERDAARRERDEAADMARRWHKVASAHEILTPPVGGKRLVKLAYRDGWECAYCGKETCVAGKNGPKATVDHVVPKSKGGLDALSNCVVACDDCNKAKGDQEDWSPENMNNKEE